jgi:hypothetical protein
VRQWGAHRIPVLYEYRGFTAMVLNLRDKDDDSILG